MFQIQSKETQKIKKFFPLLEQQKIQNSLMNMQLVDGLNGLNQKNKMIGIIYLEYRFNNHQLINFWEIEHFQHGLVNKIMEFFIYQLIHLPIKREVVILMYQKIFHLKIDIINGSLFILDTLDQKKRLLPK